MFSYKIVNRIFENVLVDESDIFVNFCIKGGVKKLLQRFFLVEARSARQTTTDFSSDTCEYNESNKCLYLKYYLKFTCSVNETFITKIKGLL